MQRGLIGAVCRAALEDEAPVAIGAVDIALLADGEEDAGVAEGANLGALASRRLNDE